MSKKLIKKITLSPLRKATLTTKSHEVCTKEHKDNNLSNNYLCSFVKTLCVPLWLNEWLFGVDSTLNL
jgi:hypothetical protein